MWVASSLISNPLTFKRINTTNASFFKIRWTALAEIATKIFEVSHGVDALTSLDDRCTRRLIIPSTGHVFLMRWDAILGAGEKHLIFSFGMKIFVENGPPGGLYTEIPG